jgi:hypothetical protein
MNKGSDKKPMSHRDREYKKPIPRLGSISGTLSWPKGAIPVTSTIVSEIDLKAEIITLAPAKPPDFPSWKIIIVGSNPIYGNISTISEVVSVPYTVESLPLGIPIQILAKPRHQEGSFEHSGPLNVTCTFGVPVISNYDLDYLEPPK